MTRLSVNVNKIATLRNARGKNNPDLIQVVKDCERFGAEGITIHPRPDERHITTQDVYDLKQVISTEYNIEGYPDDRYLEIIEKIRPEQATLVPDPPDVLTSNAGWNITKNKGLLKEVISTINQWGVRTSIFLDPDISQVELAADIGTSRIELYTESYAEQFPVDPEKAIKAYKAAAKKAVALGLGLNAGHDLNRSNLLFFQQEINGLLEVSIGHALICDALYYGLENTIQLYLRQLK
jgi:pyridoxine 5-phosphate synthase